MAEFIIGTGQTPTVRVIVKTIEEQIRLKEGIPRFILARANNIEFEAERDDFQGNFTRWILRMRVPEACLNRILGVVKENSDVCSAERQQEWLIVSTKDGIPANLLPKVYSAIDKVCQCVTLPEVWKVRGDRYRIDRISPELLFQAMIQYKASDVHLSPGECPLFRVDGDMRHSELMGPLSAIQILDLIRQIIPDRYREEFERANQTSFSYHQAGLGYARVSAFYKMGAPHCTFRFLPERIPSFEELNIPKNTMLEIAEINHGLVLVTGMTGSGKTTTVAAIIDWINAHKSYHILTIENPIEYVHVNKKSIISQRNMGDDVMTFNEAVTGALRHDPDVIVIGEMRDPDTIRAAINAAATGHLVISTLHSNTASEVVNRIVSFFDPSERDLVRLQLRDCIRCIICQRLVPKVGGGRIPALEIMYNDIKAINDGILSGDTDLIRVGMQQTVSHSFIFEQYIHKLYKDERITLEHAREAVTDRSTLDQLLMGTYSVPRLDSIKGKSEHEAFRV